MPSPDKARQKPPRDLGHVDHVSDGIVRGWAFDAKRPKLRLQVEVYWRGLYLGRTSAGLLRDDLRANGIGDGRHAFVFHLPDDAPDDLDGHDLEVVASGPSRRFALAFAERVAPGRDATQPVDAGLREMLGPFLAAVAARTPVGAESIAMVPSRRLTELFAPEAAIGISAFVAHVARKYERPELAAKDRDGLLRWYVGSYAMERGQRRAPLSREDLAALRRLRPPLLGEEIGARGIERAYRWAIEASRRVFVEDCLVSPQQVRRLRATRLADILRAYPLPTFLRILRRRHPVLRAVDIAGTEGRRRLYAVAAVLALREPHLLRYLPRPWLDRLLDEPGTLASTLTSCLSMGLDGRHYRGLVADAGFDLATQSFAGSFVAGHRVGAGPRARPAARRFDVQLIGPVGRLMGLGESCRRVADALRATPFSVNVVDYDLGNASPRNADFGSGRLGTARLNILHLNAEEIPEALASLPHLLSEAPLVAIPYWELDRPSAVHGLGLRLVDETWVASSFLEKVFAGAGAPVSRIGMSASEQPEPDAQACTALRAKLGLAPDAFAFLTTSDALSWVQRKNPLGVVAAFRAAFPDDDRVALVVKTHNLDGPLSDAQRAHWDEIRDIAAADPRIRLVDETFDAPAQRTLLAAADALVSLHRAEGLGLDVLDALALGTPVVATAYSGTTDVCTDETAWLVTADIGPVPSTDYCFVEPGHRWADPDRAAAIEALRAVRTDAPRRGARVAAGRALIAAEASRHALARRLEANVRRLLAD